jgi:hypothetical protein
MLLSSALQRRTPALVVPFALLALACSDDTQPTAPDAEGPPAFEVSDAPHGGNPHFYFLPPLAPAPTAEGTFDPTLAPTVRICALPACASDLVTLVTGTGPGAVKVSGQAYRVIWHSRAAGLAVGGQYRVRVYVGDLLLGFADLQVVAPGAPTAVPEGVVAVRQGQPVQIRFRIEESALDVTCAAPSPIAFMKTAPSLLGIFLINPDGTGLRQLTDGQLPVWSPDRCRVAFFARGLEAINADGSGRVNLTTALPQDILDGLVTFRRVHWSPDARTIAFEVNTSGDQEDCCPNDIWLVESDGTNPRKLVTNGSSPSWSPDGQKIAFESSRDGDLEIYMVAVDGSGVTRLTTRPGRDQQPVWSPDGSRIAFASWGSDTGPYDIAVINPDGSGFVNLTQGERSTDPVWIGDGSRIGFLSDHNQISVMNADGTDRRVLTQEDGIHSVFSWSRDGSQVVFVKNDPRGDSLLDPELYIIDADGTGLKNVSNSPDTYDTEPDW